MFRDPTNGRNCSTIAAIIFVFFGLSRIHVLKQLDIDSLSSVGKRGLEYKILRYSPSARKMVLFSDEIMGVFFNICDNFHPAATVYLPKLSDKLQK